jgi:flagellar hook-associated protein 3 FlgL
MAITPINIARVSNNMQTLSLLSSLQANQLDLFLQQNRLASGLRINAPSDDPVGAAQALELTQALERQEQILANIRHASSFMDATDVAIGQISELLIDARGIASEMVNSTADQAQRDSQAELIRSMINSMVDFGNRSYEGMYLFGGQQTTEMPFTRDTGGVEYRGDGGMLLTHVGVDLDEQFNLTGGELFGSLTGVIEGTVDLDSILTEDTRLADLAGAANLGVELSFVRVSLDPPGVSFVADLSQADNVGDVIDYLHAAAEEAGLTTGAGGQFEVSINGDQNGLTVSASGGDVTITEVGGSTTARDLGILGSGAGQIDGIDVQPLLTGETTIASLFGGTGATLGSIEIQNGETAYTVDLSAAETMQDILNALNTAGAEIVASINDTGTGINVTNPVSGWSLSIGETGGNTAATLGILSLHGGTTLDSLDPTGSFETIAGEADISIVARDGSRVDVNLDGATTVQDVLDLINAQAAADGVGITASLAVNGTGICLTDSTGGTTHTLHVERFDNGSYALDALGLDKSADNQTDTELISDRIGTVQPQSVFTALLELELALRQPGEDQEQRITAAAEQIDAFIERANRVHGLVGARAQAMMTRVDYTEQAVTATQSLLSQVRDLDYTQAITEFQQAQTILQANLMTGSRLMDLSLLNFI